MRERERYGRKCEDIDERNEKQKTKQEKTKGGGGNALRDEGKGNEKSKS